ncbi:MipA/OmpV family protein [Cognatishimia sp. F0-27]|uniref:MipA/OmpV family protein n=1 Tax=Cognatishimia sp. F0-27 TaxID=2816855 RepID=UPI001D0C667D|nr:MipA/OmpV family protein [Cognatishimia sp. F0-27]MCC1494243.1 MipA/OmpV family protein [Cognatishimia sp. F0-27]
MVSSVKACSTGHSQGERIEMSTSGHSILHRFVALLVLATMISVTLGGSASAEERSLSFELGLGARVAPTYEGSDTYQTSPSFGGGLEALSLGAISIEPGDDLGFGFAPSFRVLSERTADDDKALTGIDDVDLAFELGAKVSYRWDGAEAFAALRKGVTGHDGLVMDFGADVIMTPGTRTELRFGPRMSWADDAYMDTYFSVPAGATLRQYDAEGGLRSYGLEMSMRYDMSDVWAVEGTLGYDRLTGSAADSPIVDAGSRDQGSVGIQIIRTFNLRF